jgi:hypothetical protein
LRAAADHDRVTTLIGLGLPVSPVDERNYDFGFLRSCSKPKLFVSGGRDQYGPRAKLEQVFDSFAEPKKLVLVDSADHFFEGRLKEMRDAIDSWVREIIPQARAG